MHVMSEGTEVAERWHVMEEIHRGHMTIRTLNWLSSFFWQVTLATSVVLRLALSLWLTPTKARLRKSRVTVIATIATISRSLKSFHFSSIMVVLSTTKTPSTLLRPEEPDYLVHLESPSRSDGVLCWDKIPATTYLQTNTDIIIVDILFSVVIKLTLVFANARFAARCPFLPIFVNILLLGTTLEPPKRLASKAEGRNWLDGVVSVYAQRSGISLASPGTGGGIQRWRRCKPSWTASNVSMVMPTLKEYNFASTSSRLTISTHLGIGFVKTRYLCITTSFLAGLPLSIEKSPHPKGMRWCF